jgi:hypothetical protein
VISRTTPRFWSCYDALPGEIQRAADAAYAQWKRNPLHRSLRFKKLEGHANLWSARVSRQYRSLALRRGDEVTWVWIGHHTEYERLIR